MLKKNNKKGNSYKLDQSLQKAEAMINQGDLLGAEKKITKILSRHSNSDLAMVLLGFIYHQRKQDKAAIKVVEKAVVINPHDAKYYKLLADCYRDIDAYIDAESNYKCLLELTPDNADAYNDLAALYKKTGRYAEAVQGFQRAIELKPDHVVAHTNLGFMYTISCQNELAMASLLTALKIEPLFPAALMGLGDILSIQGKQQLALDCYQKAIKIEPELVTARKNWMGLVENLQVDEYTDALEEDFLLCMRLDGVEYQSLARPISSLMSLKYGYRDYLKMDRCNMDVEVLSQDELLLEFLIKVINTDKATEVFLTLVRKHLLLDTERVALNQSLPLMAAISQQCINNEYVLDVSVEEAERLKVLRHTIESLGCSVKVTPDLEISTLLFSMYESLWTLNNREALLLISRDVWSGVLHGVLQCNLYDADEENKLRDGIRTLIPIKDKVSSEVQAQYEENPYPRWMYLEEKNEMNLSMVLRNQLSQFSPPDFIDQPKNILVAGCGTGKHPIMVSKLAYSNSRIVAVDLSKSSLAYAKRMANKLSVSNIEFMQSDILDLGQLEERFHVIESIGVLHHMKNPMAGFRILVGLLEDQGLMRIGLYSELARQDIVAGRAIISEYEIGSEADDIRSMRQEIFSSENAIVAFLTNRKDFYSLSDCRDLLFHVQEHRYTIPEIKSTLEELGLRFLGFTFHENLHKRRFVEHFPDEVSLLDLDCWHTYEQHYPETFVSMYNFWCQKV
ncbi:MAG: tetratricopeptide repeat protein [Gammaproteobacteria bacterium]|nr:tetratricopeptide repeat protein [Gammaproteobacteria bacterium]